MAMQGDSGIKEDVFITESKCDPCSTEKTLVAVEPTEERPPLHAPKKKKPQSDIAYKLDAIPPWYLCLALGFQHYLTMFGGTVTYPYLIAPKLCMPAGDPSRGYLISTTFFVSGLSTFLQTTFGVRLPIVQGSTVALFVPILAILQLPQWQCPDPLDNINGTTPIDWDEEWMTRMREVQGAIIGASLLEVAIGFTGVMGVILTWITPLAIAPTITLVGLSLFMEAANSAAGHWGIAFFTILLLILFSQYFQDMGIPWPKHKKGNGISCTGSFPLFKLFPVLLTIVSAWALCGILTATNVFPEGSAARTDIQKSIMSKSPWFRFPYPGQWGMPTFSTAAIFGAVAGIMASAIESVGDYYACARLAGAPPPPTHAINRGIWAEGIGCILAGIWGTGGGLTSYSENIGAIGITKVASRRVIQYGSILMILFGLLGKVGALFVTIPEPIVGGVFCIMFAMISAVGISTLQYVDLSSSRNLFVIGFSLFMGLSVPKWLQANPGAINLGEPVITQIVTVFLSTSMFVGGFIGFLLDNSIPGTDEERGIYKWKEAESPTANDEVAITTTAYDIPYLMPTIRRIPLFQYVPISPTFSEDLIKRKLFGLKDCCRKKNRPQSYVDPNTVCTHV